jgi:GNAT superfamily N-acetyltransferase
MICESCRYNDPPGFVRNGAELKPCPDCGGTMVAHCPDGLTACNEVIDVRAENPDSAAARWCLEQYFTELAARFDGGFDPARSISANVEEMTPPAGFFVVAWLNGAPAGCGALKVGAEGTGEVKRMWTAPEARGLGIARRVLRLLEAQAREAGLTRLRLETNRALTEAQAFYRAEGYQEVDPFNAELYAHHWFEKRLGAVPARRS